MAKMSKTQQENVRAAHANLNSNGRQIATTARGREYLWNNGWMAPNLRPTTAGLIAAGVDMDAIETEAHKENNRREADDRAGILARHAAEVRDLDHAEALEAAHDEALHHLPKDCPDPRRACGRCTSPAAARAVRGDDSAYRTVAEVQLEQIEAELNGLREQRRALDEQLKAARELHDEAIDARLAELTNEQIMADETLLRWLLKASWAHTGANARKHVLTKPGVPELRDEYVDGRDEYAADVLPALQLVLTKDQDITPVADALRAWAQTWALGRPDLHISILERTLSQRASYGFSYFPATGTAAMDSLRWGHSDVGAEVPLEDLLREVARDLWYESSSPADADTGEDDELSW